MFASVPAGRYDFRAFIEQVIAVVVHDVCFLVEAKHTSLRLGVVGMGELSDSPFHGICGISFFEPPDFLGELRFFGIFKVSKRFRVVIVSSLPWGFCDAEVKFFTVGFHVRRQCSVVKNVSCRTFTVQGALGLISAVAALPFYRLGFL